MEVKLIYFYLFIYLFIYIDTYKAELLGQISLPQSPRQETFWASAGLESTEKSVTLSDAPRRLNES